jgi:hypothetical protein
MVRSALKNALVAKRLPIALGKGRFLDPDPEVRIAAKVNYGLAMVSANGPCLFWQAVARKMLTIKDALGTG